jgi:hypothetical protein
MNDEKLIWNFLTNEFKDSHPIVFIYASGNQVRSKETAILKAMKTLTVIFCPPYEEDFVKKVLTDYLNHKHTQFRRNEIKLTPLY